MNFFSNSCSWLCFIRLGIICSPRDSRDYEPTRRSADSASSPGADEPAPAVPPRLYRAKTQDFQQSQPGAVPDTTGRRFRSDSPPSDQDGQQKKTSQTAKNTNQARHHLSSNYVNSDDQNNDDDSYAQQLRMQAKRLGNALLITCYQNPISLVQWNFRLCSGTISLVRFRITPLLGPPL